MAIDSARIALRIAVAPIHFCGGHHAPWKHQMAGYRNIMFAEQAGANTPWVTAFLMQPSLPFAVSLLILTGCGFFAPIEPVLAQQVSREQDIGDLRLGQRVKVDDGTCPAGQIKEISGTKMTSTGIVRVQKCIPRLGPKRK
jgi:hypothetical protein